jgi:dihydroorotase
MQLTITQPDDWHLHLRDDAALMRTVGDTSRYFARAIVMPNLSPPVINTEQALQYRQRIIDAIPHGRDFMPLMTLYLTDNTTAAEVRKAHASGAIHAIKLYPAGATTNSDAGVTDLKHCQTALAEMERLQMPLLIHGEVTDSDIDIFDREKIFIDRVLAPLLKDYPELRVVLEHITTSDSVEFVLDMEQRLAATITPHHLLLNRNDLLVGGIRPHHFCLPVLKRNTHQQALINAATSGHPQFFLGTDSAPHQQQAKESACGCAGIYSAHAALELYAEAFEQANALDKLEAFASHFGADFYRLPRNTRKVTLNKDNWTVPESYPLGQQSVIPLRAGQSISWQVNPLAN